MRISDILSKEEIRMARESLRSIRLEPATSLAHMQKLAGLKAWSRGFIEDRHVSRLYIREFAQALADRHFEKQVPVIVEKLRKVADEMEERAVLRERWLDGDDLSISQLFTKRRQRIMPIKRAKEAKGNEENDTSF